MSIREMMYQAEEDDEDRRVADQMKKCKEKMINEKRMKQINQTFKQQREKAYFNPNQAQNYGVFQQMQPAGYYEPNSQQIFYQNYINQEMIRQQQSEGYNNYDLAIPQRHIYDFNQVPPLNLNFEQMQPLQQMMQYYSTNLSNSQLPYQQQQRNNSLNSYEYQNIYNHDESTIKKQQNYQQQYTIYEDFDNEQEEETQECYFYENKNIYQSKQKSNYYPTYQDNYSAFKQIKDNFNKENSFSSKKSPYLSDLQRIEDSFNKINTPQKFFATDRSNQPILSTPSATQKIINNLNSIQLTPRNEKYTNAKPQDGYKSHQTNITKYNSLFEKETIIDCQQDIRQKYQNSNQQSKSRIFQGKKEQKQRVQESNQKYENNNQNKFNFDQYGFQKNGEYQSQYKRVTEYKNAAINFSQNQLITIKDYQFSMNKKIGQGAFSQVFLGHKRLNPNFPVAVKIIDLQKQSKFQEEIEICLKINGNKNILRIYDYHLEKSNNKCYLFLEFCEGGNLESINNTITRRQAIIYFRQILDGMKELLRHKIIHRDIKLENILINEGQIKISDFGLSKQVQNNLLDVNSIKCGTPSTMAPEIFFSHTSYPSYNNKCDVWSLAVILHEMFYKVHPFNMNKEMLRKFQRIQVEHKCDIVEDFLSKSLVYNQKKRMSLEEIFNHKIYTADISEFKLQENQVYLAQVADKKSILQTETIKQVQTQSKVLKSGEKKDQIKQNKNGSIQTLSLIKSIIFESFTQNNFGLALLLLIVVGLIIAIILLPFFSN
ncbi:Serine/Threonine kinase domain protein (macronuclear) [Tetrahymena thermophila SB210]|uniref:Serine/Threonine kinase domain protein n=1 Tax=Tetrahymena thermophila (strain SB210) TaxID=312017 RepID=I7M092_TETTS|nr:Serine/Threonine kinase domain protein [Tetrahymena thermophila SB210]EAR85704.2 Serine/Threonine kinase domain protein [Tetrahymena thermophila SB210]|eukprot:XP_001033367.2 Serine/Threonine kinase domain protein [Tetrahymena thermophila SB210]